MKLGLNFKATPWTVSAKWLYYPFYTLGLIAIWQVYISLSAPPAFILPSPQAVASAFAQASAQGIFWVNLFYTFGNILLGFFAGTILGIVLGYVLWKSPLFRRYLGPYITIFQAIPKIAIAPLLVLWFGLGYISQLSLILIMAFFPLMLATQEGLSQVKTGYRDLASIYHFSTWQYFHRIQFYSILPNLFAGAKIALLDAITGAFLSEFITAKRGLGYLMVFGNSSFDSALLFVAILSTIALGLLGYTMIAFLENGLLWKE